MSNLNEEEMPDGFQRLHGVLNNPAMAYKYAANILKKRWADIGKPEVEDMIGKDPVAALNYAINVLKKRWADIGKPEVEDVIGKDPWSAYYYAQDILKKRWADIGKPEMEDVIGKNAGAAYYYAIILEKRWADIGKPEVEDMIGKDPWSACLYAQDILKKRWADIGEPEVEDVINKNSEAAQEYAKVIKLSDKAKQTRERWKEQLARGELPDDDVWEEEIKRIAATINEVEDMIKDPDYAKFIRMSDKTQTKERWKEQFTRGELPDDDVWEEDVRRIVMKGE